MLLKDLVIACIIKAETSDAFGIYLVGGASLGIMVGCNGGHLRSPHAISSANFATPQLRIRALEQISHMHMIANLPSKKKVLGEMSI